MLSLMIAMSVSLTVVKYHICRYDGGALLQELKEAWERGEGVSATDLAHKEQTFMSIE